MGLSTRSGLCKTISLVKVGFCTTIGCSPSRGILGYRDEGLRRRAVEEAVGRYPISDIPVSAIQGRAPLEPRCHRKYVPGLLVGKGGDRVDNVELYTNMQHFERCICKIRSFAGNSVSPRSRLWHPSSLGSTESAARLEVESCISCSCSSCAFFSSTFGVGISWSGFALSSAILWMTVEASWPFHS